MPVLELKAADHEKTKFAELEKDYSEQLKPILKRFCLDCHSTEKEEGELDLERFASLVEVRRDPEIWQKVVEMLDNGEMPPEDSEQPSDAQRKQLRSWIESYLDTEARTNAGDPGPVILRRLSNAEYNYTVRDLTGVALSDLAGLQERIRRLQREALSKTTAYLAAAAEVAAGQRELPQEKLAELAAKHKLDLDALNVWLDYLAISEVGPVIVSGHFKETEINGD